MIKTSRFVIPHIGKTGGDAIKLIVARLNLPDIQQLIGVNKPSKHWPVDPQGRDLVLPIRQLPRREISWLMHHKKYGKKWRDKGVRWILEQLDGERELEKHLSFGVRPKYYIRSEFLRRDLIRVLRHYYKLTNHQLHLCLKAPTKARIQGYNRRMGSHYRLWQIVKLYDGSPLWSQCERDAYGRLLTDILI